MAGKSGVVAWVQYVAARFAFALLEIFPIEWNLKTARLLTDAWIRLMPRHLARAIDHLQAAYDGERSPEDIRAIARASLEHWTKFVVEVIAAPRLLTNFTWSRYIHPINLGETVDVLLQGRGVIMLSGHFGHFEIPGYLLSHLGFDVCAVMRPLDNVYLNSFLVRARASHGMKLIDKKGAMAAAQDLLAGGTLLAFVADQNAGRKGIFVDFFGRPASTYKSIGLLAMVTKAPIVVGYARRCGSGFCYEVGVERIIYPREWEHQDDPLHWITQTYTAAIEATARRSPEQYMWMHRRWKTRPKA